MRERRSRSQCVSARARARVLAVRAGGRVIRARACAHVHVLNEAKIKIARLEGRIEKLQPAAKAMKEVSGSAGGLYKNGAETAEQLKPSFELRGCVLPARSAPATKSEPHAKSPPKLPRGKEARADGKGGGQFSAVKKFCVHPIYVECARGASAVPPLQGGLGAGNN